MSFELSCFFFFNDTATTEIYTLSLHDALPISWTLGRRERSDSSGGVSVPTSLWRSRSRARARRRRHGDRSEEHTSELQSHSDLVCRLLLEKKKKRDQSAMWTWPRSGYAG